MANSPYEALYAVTFPKDIVENFDLIDVQSTDERVDVYLDEKNHLPQGYTEKDLRKNGFTEATELRDFPIMGKPTTLHLRRRRWTKVSDNSNVVTDWQLAAEGTRHSRAFAAFLKEILGFIPDYGPLA